MQLFLLAPWFLSCFLFASMGLFFLICGTLKLQFYLLSCRVLDEKTESWHLSTNTGRKCFSQKVTSYCSLMVICVLYYNDLQKRWNILSVIMSSIFSQGPAVTAWTTLLFMRELWQNEPQATDVFSFSFISLPLCTYYLVVVCISLIVFSPFGYFSICL